MASAFEIASRLDREASRRLCDDIRYNLDRAYAHAGDAYEKLLQLHEGMGWLALGYESWRECVTHEFNQSESTLYRKLTAARVLRELRNTDFDFPHVGKLESNVNEDPKRSDTLRLPSRQVDALADAPEGTRAQVLDVASKAAGGKPTEKTVKAAVKAKKAQPDAPVEQLVAAVKTTVNGEARADAAVERARAAGRIPAGVVVTVEDPGDDAIDIEAVVEEHHERAAKDGEVSDDEWLESLPLTSKLAGVSLKKFRLDALYYRRFDAHIRCSLKTFHGRTRREVFGQSEARGFVPMRVELLLKVEHPMRWHSCPAPDKGGCEGLGTVPMIGECPTCRGKGYLAR